MLLQQLSYNQGMTPASTMRAGEKAGSSGNRNTTTRHRTSRKDPWKGCGRSGGDRQARPHLSKNARWRWGISSLVGNTTATKMTNSGTGWFLIGAVSMLAFIVYANGLTAEFVYDDRRAIVNNEDLRPDTPWSNLLYNDFWGTPIWESGSHKSYRPVCSLTFRINYILTGLNPFSYHLTNVLLHCLATTMVTCLSISLLQDTLSALFTGALFAVHPIHTEAVTGVVGRADILACILFLASFGLYVRYCNVRSDGESKRECPDADDGVDHLSVQIHRWVYLGGSLMCATLSMLSKEQGIAVVGVCACYDYFIHSRKNISRLLHATIKDSAYHMGEGILVLASWGVIAIAARICLMGKSPPSFSPADNPAANNASFLTRTMTFWYLPTFNFWLLAWPMELSFDWSMSSIPLIESVSDLRNVSSLIFYTALCLYIGNILKHYFTQDEAGMSHLNYQKRAIHSVCSSSSSKRSREKGLRSSPTLDLKKGSHLSKGVGFSNGHSDTGALPLAIDASDEFGHNRRHYDILFISSLILVLPFLPASNLFFYVGFVIAERVLYLPSVGFCLLAGELFLHLHTKLTHGSRGLQNVFKVCSVICLVILSGRTIVRNMDWQNEETLYLSGASVNPAKAWGNLGNVYSARGDHEDAERAYKQALSHRENMADIHYNLGVLYQDQKRYEDALKEYKRAIECRPRLTIAHLNTGIIKNQLGLHKEAEQSFKRCSAMDITGLKDPKLHSTAKTSALYNWGKLKADQGLHEEAMVLYNQAVRLKPDHYSPHKLYNMLGESHFSMGNEVEAEKFYRKSLEVKPDHHTAYLTMAKLLRKQKRESEAEAYLRKAVSTKPEESLVFQHYAEFLADAQRFNEAVAMTSRAVRLDPNHYDIVFTTASILRQAGRTEEALIYYKKAVSISPLDPLANMNLGAMYHMTKQYDLAEVSYLATLKLKPGDQVTHDNLVRLRRLKKGPDSASSSND